ncbi:hypothetical protein AB1Y20_005245 [Prymnesium parvum]|uniref:Uncharacterized protein n=1 Tax=Prymnesium parvum TaxID=97485 RepID=A0AB34J5A4_PRYPA
MEAAEMSSFRRSPRLLTLVPTTAEGTNPSTATHFTMQPCSRVGDDSMQHSAPLCAPTTDSLPEANTTTSKGVPSMPIEPNTSAAVVPLSAAPAASVTIAQLQEMALSLGCVVTPIKKWAKAIAHAIASSLRTREGDFIYQSASIRMPEVPRAAVMQILPEPKSSSASQITWEWEYASEVSQCLSNLLPLSGMQTAGATRAIQRPSEPVIRVMATMMGGLEIRHFKSNRGSEVLTINFLYILMGEMGDLHPPKDPQRREIGLDDVEATELRQIVLRDARAMGEAGAQLSPGWWLKARPCALAAPMLTMRPTHL